MEEQMKQIKEKYNHLRNPFRQNKFGEYLTKEQVEQIEEWTSLKCSDIIFDSNKDNWNQGKHQNLIKE